MFGLRPEMDKYPMAQPKSYNFAQKLSGRFFVSGVSGSLKKHSDNLKALKQPMLNRIKATAPIFEKKVEIEFEKDAARLAELEEQLEEIRRQKELRHKRQANRQGKKILYLAACKIQRLVRLFLKKCRRRKGRAASVVLGFLNMMMAKNAISVAAMASGIISRFAKRVSVPTSFLIKTPSDICV